MSSGPLGDSPAAQSVEVEAQGGPAAPPEQFAEPSLIESVISRTETEGAAGATARQSGVLERFLGESSTERAAALWVTQSGWPRQPENCRQLSRYLSRDIARLDDMLQRQVNAILHAPAFQKLESSWRGLRYLTEQVPEGENTKIKVLSVSWKELEKDFERSMEFDQSQLFRMVYSNEFGMAGGEPYGVLLGDYEIHPRPGAGHPTDDLAILRSVSGVAAAAFAPFISAADPSMFGLNSFTGLEQPLDLAGAFQQADFVKWRSFRQTEDARFVGLTAPRILMRLPYEDDSNRTDGFRFKEDVETADRSRYLWGNACYAFGAVLVRSFAEHGWLADIRGVNDERYGGGIVEDLPVQSFGTDSLGIAPKSSTDAMITDVQEKQLSELGFIPLCHCKDTDCTTFYSNQSVQEPKDYDRESARANARLSAMIQYMLCVSRVAHYVKVIGRDKMGGFATPSDCESYIERWLQNYIINDDKASYEQKAAYPLREARVQVRETPGKPGSYQSVIHLKPHFQVDQVVTAVKLTTELVAAAGG